LNPNKITLSILDDSNNIIDMFLFNKKIGKIKLIAKRIDISFDIPDIKLSLSDSNININNKLIKTIIKDINIKYDNIK
jgi:hypothetical protein